VSGQHPPKTGGFTMNEQKIWDKRAEVFDRLEWARNEEFINFFINECNTRSNSIFLDVGCGTGIITRKLMAKASKVIGIDISSKMIQKAIAQTNSEQLSEIGYVLMDAQSMGLKTESIALVSIRMALHHIKDVVKALTEVHRILVKNGKVVICEGVPPDHRVRERYEQIFALKEERHTFSEAELINLLYKVGFRNIVLKPFFMEQVSLVNWLKNSAVSDKTAKQILKLHLEADDYFKRVYNMKVLENDTLIDWKFIVLTAEKL
jgi:ubiquinone/menaquinone biosynthesis C-methylase UbiE